MKKLFWSIFAATFIVAFLSLNVEIIADGTVSQQDTVTDTVLDGGTLPEVTITCNRYATGFLPVCWENTKDPLVVCRWNGSQTVYCVNIPLWL